MLVQAPIGVALAAVFLEESVRIVQLAGGLAILAAAISIQRSAAPEQPEAPLIDGSVASEA